ncbi:hypothetical protein BdWA1_002792 [Babesia duncani]|uniref:Uncharacterized protein n=1 Tax=Babesia duncani TaxID=323732 RepID=A0AAD9PJV1_9APIC|nr:hypothetical protein BdWA1_002792 [Babesia duncani]
MDSSEDYINQNVFYFLVDNQTMNMKDHVYPDETDIMGSDGAVERSSFEKWDNRTYKFSNKDQYNNDVSKSPDDPTILIDSEYDISSDRIKRFIYLVAMMQGMVLMLVMNACYLTSTMIHIVLDVEAFGALITLVFHGFILLADLIIFWVNPLMPWVTAGFNLIQGTCCLFLMTVISITNGVHGKLFFLAVIGLLGSIFGMSNITTFALVNFAPINYLGSFSFGLALGGLIPYLITTLLRYVIVPGKCECVYYYRMLFLIGLVCLMTFVNGIVLLVYLESPPIKNHYNRMITQEAGSVKCTFRNGCKGLPYCWVLLLINAILLLNLFTFFPGIIPGIWDVSVNTKVQMIGIIQVGLIITRGYAVFMPKKAQIKNKYVVLLIASTNFAISSYFVLEIMYFKNMLLSTLPARITAISLLALNCGYCLAYTMTNLDDSIPRSLSTDVRTSTTMMFGVAIDIFYALGSFISQLLLLYVFK